MDTTSRGLRLAATGALSVLTVGGTAGWLLAQPAVASNSNLNKISSSLKSGERSTFSATYTINSSGRNETLTIAQSPPKSLLKTGGATVINTGRTTYYCTSYGSQHQCVKSTGSNPLVGLASAFSAPQVLSSITGAEQQVNSHANGYSVSTSSANYAGQPSTCVSVTGQGRNAKYCVTNSGVVAYVGSSSGSFRLTSYTKRVSGSSFSTPSGATSITTPGGQKVNIP